jgi:hypothetical protein
MSPIFIHKGKILQRNNKIAANENCCCCNVAGLTLTYAAGGEDGHVCDAARYMCLLSSPGGQETEVGIVNLNNLSTGDEVIVTLTITDEQAKQITKDADDCCILLVRLRCETPPDQNFGWGLGGCHADLARLKVTAKDKNGNNVVVFQGQAGEATISLNACPEQT